jgi:anaerobic selenocysteine-containing dehydrogenase
VRISWDEALDTVAEKMLAARSEFGAESVAFYRPAPGGSPSGDFLPWLQRLAHAFGSPNTAATTHICNWHRDYGAAYTYGVGTPQADYENAGCIIIWGTNPHATGVRHVAPIKAAVARGAKLIVIDPRRIPLTRDAAAWLPVRPGTDLALILGLINQIIENGAYDRAFLSRWTNAPLLVRDDTNLLLTEADLTAGGSTTRYVVWDSIAAETALYDPDKVDFVPHRTVAALDASMSLTLADGSTVGCRTVFAALRGIAADYTLTRTAQLTDIDESAIATAAQVIGEARPLCYYSFNGIEQHTDAMQTNRAIGILYALTGDFDRKGGMVIYPSLRTKGISEVGLLPDGAAEKRLGVVKRPLGPAGGPHKGKPGNIQAYEIYNAILTGEPYSVRALISFGGNLIVSNGDTRRGARALQSLDFYMHMDFYENPTARFADILLPAASSWESEVVGQAAWRGKGHIQMRRAVVAPEYERRSDLDVMFALAKRMGLNDAFYGGDVETAFDDVLSPLGRTVSDIRAMERGMSIPLSARYQKYAESDPTTGAPRGFNTPSRLLEIYSRTFAENGFAPLPRYAEPPELQVDRNRFPLLLTASKPAAFTHGSYRSVPSLRKLVPEPGLEVNPTTAMSRGIADGDWVSLQTPKGAIRAKARYNTDLSPDIISGEEGWWQECAALGLPGYDPLSETGSNLNLLFTNDLIDPISGSVPHRGYPCQIARL